jgi:hypothetical protein
MSAPPNNIQEIPTRLTTYFLPPSIPLVDLHHKLTIVFRPSYFVQEIYFVLFQLACKMEGKGIAENG